MNVPRSVIVVRTACLTGLLAAAASTVEGLHPDRGFCPLAEACAKARESPLGHLGNLPTSVVGIAGFAVLLLLTSVPARAARLLARPAAWLGGLAALGLVGYQAFVLRSFCPLCLVADASALSAAAAAFTWRALPSRAKIREEPVAVRFQWLAAAALLATIPFAWPHAPKRPSWVAIPDSIAVADDMQDAAAAAPAALPPVAGAPTVPAMAAPAVEPPAAPRLGKGEWYVPPPRFEPYRPPGVPRRPPAASSTSGSLAAETTPPTAPLATAPPPAPPPAPPTPPPPAPPPSVEPPGDPAPAAPAPLATAPPPAPPPSPAAAPAARAIPVVMYLNPFCPHCRATDQSLRNVLASFQGPVRQRRVYVWATDEKPFWAWAIACGMAKGVEQAVFDALEAAPNESPDQVRAAAARAGIDGATLDAAMKSSALRARLDQDHATVLAARIEGLPTLDIGRRRLMGEQSEAELIEALEAARHR